MQAVMGGETPLETKGLLAFWAKVAYEKLADTRNTKYFMQDYVDYLDNGVAAISALLYHGMTLSMFVASSECRSVISIQIKYLLFILFIQAKQMLRSEDKTVSLMSRRFVIDSSTPITLLPFGNSNKITSTTRV